MTTQKIIDNIQTRLENLISERFSGSYQQIDISCSDYNPTIDTTVTITITVTDQNDDPVTGFTVPLKIDGTSITGITTNSSGVATHTYTCTEWGSHKINVKSVSAFINVTGWKTHTNTSDYTFSYNHELCELRIHIASTTISGNPEVFGGFTVPAGYRPATPVVSPIFVGNRAIVQVRDNGQVSRCSYSGSAIYNAGVYVTLQWKY